MSKVTVDFIAKGESKDIWLMVLLEQGPWRAPYEENLRRLQDRLYGCIDGAIYGGLAAKDLTRNKRIKESRERIHE